MVMKPFSLIKLACMAGVRAISLAVNTWVEILCAFIYFNISIFWRFVVWSLSLVTLPVRALAALHREKQLQVRLNELEDSVDSLQWNRKELQEHIRVATKEHEMMEMMLVELEEEHDEAIRKIKLLETELQDLKDKNHRVNELHGKSQWDTDHYKHNKDGMPPLKADHYNVTGILTRKDPSNDIKKVNLGAYDVAEVDVAVSQSLFSAILSLVVGMVIWEAQDPCMPLVTALLMVVGMSLRSVVQLFSTIKNTPASDAVALLSLNWFILGMLVYPTLPWIARLSASFFTKSSGGGWVWV